VKRCCFIAMPLRPEFKEVSDAILPAFDEPQSFQSRRITSIALGDVIETIRNSIAACECAIAVITGEDPNVMYELGLLHAVGKPSRATIHRCIRAGELQMEY
jgi:hypothetical protein